MAKLHGLAVALAAALATAGCATLVPPLPEAQPQIPQGWPVPDSRLRLTEVTVD